MLDVQLPLTFNRISTTSKYSLEPLQISISLDQIPDSSTNSGRRARHSATQNVNLSTRGEPSSTFRDRTLCHMAMTRMNINANPSYPRYPDVGSGGTMQDVQSYGQLSSKNHQNSSFQPILDGNRPVSRSNNPEPPTFLKSNHEASDAIPGTSLPNGNTIVHYLQMPPTISSSKGSLAEFAAQITCLFWFESSTTLQSIEHATTMLPPVERTVPDAFPALGYLKWVTTILSTTQVAQNVILLALLFIYRLKKQNPAVKGKPGSEFRLLTVALMLGNKFLDDNTYTNKTWAEVSGIPVQEIHTMEVEFLSHMKYNLYTSKEEWQQWHAHLGKFWQYFDRASRKLYEVPQKNMAWRPPTLHIPNTLPSPPASTSASPPYASSVSPTATHYHQTTPKLPPPHLAPMIPSPVGSATEVDFRSTGRKRSWDASTHEPMPREPQNKRPYGAAPMFPHGPGVTLPGLSVPVYSGSSNASASLSGRNTPVFFPPPFAWSMPSSSGTPTSSIAAYAGALETKSARGSPYSSPLGSTMSATLPPNQLSPSHFLQYRKSPYRPVQNIRTLLVPPPSASLQNPSQHISHDQMQWQPLSKSNNESRPGLVPYINRDAWPTTLQPNQWPSLVGIYQRN